MEAKRSLNLGGSLERVLLRPGTKLVLGTAVNLPFTRGYVHISTHNHATLKYSTGQYAGVQGETNLDAWLAEWDNLGAQQAAPLLRR